MDDILPDADLRRERAVRRLGAHQARCRSCGECDPRCLEQHHIAGQAFDAETHPVCRNCHRKLSDAQRDHPEAVFAPPSMVEVIGHYLLGLADMLRLVAETLIEFGKRLIALAQTEADGARHVA